MDGIDVRFVRMGGKRLAFAEEFRRIEGEHARIAGRRIRRWARDREHLVGPDGEVGIRDLPAATCAVDRFRENRGEIPVHV